MGQVGLGMVGLEVEILKTITNQEEDSVQLGIERITC